MGSFLHFTVTGESPYPQKSGIFEVQISITDAKPSSTEIEEKSFSFIWKDTFSLTVRNGEFEEILGSEENPLPESITTFTKLWIIVTDQFSSLGSLFELSASFPGAQVRYCSLNRCVVVPVGFRFLDVV